MIAIQILTVISNKSSVHGLLTNLENINFRIGKDRLVAENYFRRLTKLITVLSTRLSEMKTFKSLCTSSAPL